MDSVQWPGANQESVGTIKDHLWGILNAVVLEISNGPAEDLNSRIKMIKVRSRGFRNKKQFANAIYFHLGGLNLYPEGRAIYNSLPPKPTNITAVPPGKARHKAH